MRKLFVAVALVAATACAGRQVEVTTGPQPTADAGIHITNNLSQAVNLYVTTGGTDVLLKQVAANAAEHVPVRGIGAGTNVTLKAITVDGTRTYTRKDIILSSVYEWRVP